MKPTQEKPEQNSAAQNCTSLASCAVRGVAWTYAALLGSRIVTFVSMIVLARILLPSAFGQLGFALLVITYLDALGDLGAGSALIFHQKRSKEAAQVAFRINLLTGALWWAVATMLAPLAADFFRDQTVEPLLRSLAWIFPGKNSHRCFRRCEHISIRTSVTARRIFDSKRKKSCACFQRPAPSGEWKQQGANQRHLDGDFRSKNPLEANGKEVFPSKHVGHYRS